MSHGMEWFYGDGWFHVHRILTAPAAHLPFGQRSGAGPASTRVKKLIARSIFASRAHDPRATNASYILVSSVTTGVI